MFNIVSLYKIIFYSISYFDSQKHFLKKITQEQFTYQKHFLKNLSITNYFFKKHFSNMLF